GTPWQGIRLAMQNGLPVPAGFIVFRSALEDEVRAAYEQLKTREKTHFVAVRGPTHAVLNVIGADQLVHTLRRFWPESSEAPVLVQRMIPSMWCGKAHWKEDNLQIEANEGMLFLDPDTYVMDGDRRCIRQDLAPKQRRMIRHVDGSAKVVEREGDRI